MISILMAAKTSTEYMRHAIASVVAQTYTDWELLIGVNGLEPQSCAYHTACDSFSGPKRVWDLPDFTSKGQTLNFLASQAHGDTVAILDVDDLWHPLKLERQIQSLYSASYQKDVIGTAADYFGDVSESIAVPTGIICHAQVLYSNPIINSSVLMRREFAQWPNRREPVEDYELWLQLSRNSRILWNMPDVLTFIRCHPTRWSHGFPTRFNPTLVRELQEKYRA